MPPKLINRDETKAVAYKERRKPAKKRVSLKVQKDASGKFIVVKGKKYRLKNNYNKEKLKSWLAKQLSVTVKNYISVPQRRAYQRKNTFPKTTPFIEEQRLRAQIESDRLNQQKSDNRDNVKNKFEPKEPKKKITKILTHKDGSQITVYNDGSTEMNIPNMEKKYDEKEEVKKIQDTVFSRPPVIRPEPVKPKPSQEMLKKLHALVNEDKEFSPIDITEDIKGFGKMDSEKGLSNIQIDELMKKFPDYIGTVSHDEVRSKILPHVRPQGRQCFIINTDPRSKAGSHWQSCYWDARPNGEKEMNFFDSYGDPIDASLQRDLKLIADKLNCNCMLKFKENRIKLQNDRSSNCGPFCCQFLYERLRGKRFRDASGYDDSIHGEASVNHFKTQVGFGYIASFGGDLPEGDDRGLVDKFLFPSNSLGSSSKAVYERFKDATVSKITVCRVPIQSFIEKFLNVASLGGFNKAKAQMGYDSLFHLYCILTTSKGEIRLEKNQKVTISTSPRREGEMINSPYSGNTTLDQFLNNGIKRMGEFKFYQYNAFSNNCQDFLIGVLGANGGLNDAVSKFIKQDISGIVKSMPQWVKRLSQGVTDFRAKIEDVFGVGRERV